MKFSVKSILYAAAVLAFASVSCVHAEDAAPADADSEVKILTADNFKGAIDEADLTLVEFFAPWCGHCKALAPEYATAAAELKDNSKIALASVDCTEYRDLCSEYGVKGFPTLKVFRNSDAAPTDYDGARKADGIVSYMKKQSLPSVSVAATDDELTAITGEESVCAVVFGEITEAFQAVADKMRNDVRFVSVTDGALAEAHGAKAGGIVFFRQFDTPKVVFDGDASSADEITAFVNASSFPLVGEIGPDNYQKYVERGLPMLWFFVADDTKEDTLGPAREIAAEFGDKFSFVSLDGVKWAEHAKSFGLKGETPGVVLEDREAGLNYIHKEGSAIDAAGLKEFCQKAVAGELEASLKSEEEPADNTAPVTVIVGTNYEKIVLDESKDVLLEFYAPWCGHCKSLAPKYDKLGEAFADSPNVVIAKIDATANDTPNKIEGFPTIKFYPSNDKKNPVTYDGGRDEESMEKWIREHATVEIAAATEKTEEKKAEGHDEL